MTSPEPKTNPNRKIVIDPPWPFRALISRYMSRMASAEERDKKRAAFENGRRSGNEPHRVEYFHQLDDPYSHLTAQILRAFAERYDIELAPHLVRAAGGRNQPELEKLAIWARRDCELIAPHYGMDFPDTAPTTPNIEQQNSAADALADQDPAVFFNQVHTISDQLWKGSLAAQAEVSRAAKSAMDKGTARLADLGHYSGATFYYGGEFYWGVDRLFHLEQRLMALGLRKDGGKDYLVPRPEISAEGVDASRLTLHFYPSLNSPYTSIIYNHTIDLARSCNINLEHKPVLPMIMRGVPATNAKGSYIMFDTKREAEHLGVPFGPMVTPIGTPTRRAYSLLSWAKEQGKDTDFMSALLRLAFAEGVSLAKTHGMRRAVTEAGLDWKEAQKLIGNDGWKTPTARNQEEMVEGMGLWGVPSYRLTGPDGEPDLEVWGQDRLWLVAAEIKRRAG